MLLELQEYYKSEYQLNFPALDNADRDFRVINSLEELPPTLENISLMVAFYIFKMRANARLELNYTYDGLKEAIEKKFLSLTVTGQLTRDDVLQLFPKPYRIPIRSIYDNRLPDADIDNVINLGDLDVELLANMFTMYLEWLSKSGLYITAKKFAGNLDFFETKLPTIADLELYARRIYKVQLKDVCLPGRLAVCRYDFLLFAEAMPRKTEQLELQDLSNADDFTDVRNKVNVYDFIHLPEIFACQEQLDRAFLKNGKKRLIVSDIVDEDGYQYVNLVQRSSGVHHLSLLGYTHIMESMGIRFLKVAGVGSGAINTALWLQSEKKEAHSTNALDKLLQIDYFNMVDGGRLSRSLFRNFKRTRTRLFATAFVIVFLLLTVVPMFVGAPLLAYFSTTAIQVSISVAVAIVFVLLYVNYLRLKRFLKFGFGLNPGTFLYDWAAVIFREAGVYNINDLIQKARQVPEKLQVRDSPGFDADALTGEAVFICRDIVTQHTIQFPRMSSLFWKKHNWESIDPALFVRAAAGTPVFYSSYVIDPIQAGSPSIRQSWEDMLGTYDIPTEAHLVAAKNSRSFPIDIFQDPFNRQMLMPTFGVDTQRTDKESDVKNLTWIDYFMRAYVAPAAEQSQSFLNKVMKVSMCDIKIDHIASTNFLLTDKEKMNLFIAGANAATEFLLSFDWELYKKTIEERRYFEA